MIRTAIPTHERCWPVLKTVEGGEGGDRKAAEELLPLVYEELRKVAAAKMASEAPGHTLQATALVHEAWLRLVGNDKQLNFKSRPYFFAAAAEAMRRILIERARRKKLLGEKGGFSEREDYIESIVIVAPTDELLAVHDALDRLAARDPEAAELVKLRYFVGMSMKEAAEALGMPLRSTESLWTFAKTWLRKEIPT